MCLRVSLNHATPWETRDAGGVADAWHHERAHILRQAFPLPHVRVHVDTLGLAWRRRRLGEFLGQVPRIILAGPAYALGRAPIGNIGGSNVSLFKPLPIPADLQELLGSQ
jgi:hypothetical protein